MLLRGKTFIITGSSRGIGHAIARQLAQQGANIVITGKTTEPHPKLEGTIYTVADEIKALGVEALPIELDVRSEESIQAMVEKTIQTFGRIDGLVNNASAINLANTSNLPLKTFDLMMQVNTRGTFACSKYCLPYLKKSDNPHIVTLSPPINLDPKWFKNHVAYTIAKYGMSMCTLGMAQEFRSDKIAVNSIWPRTVIATAAIKNLFPPEVYAGSRRPEIVALAVEKMIQEDSSSFTGNFLIDEDYLRTKGITDFSSYALDPNVPFIKDYFLED